MILYLTICFSYSLLIIYRFCGTFCSWDTGAWWEPFRDVDEHICTFRPAGPAESWLCRGLPGSQGLSWTGAGCRSNALSSDFSAASWASDSGLAPHGEPVREARPGSGRGPDGGGGVGWWRHQSVPVHLAERQLPVSTVHPAVSSGQAAGDVWSGHPHRDRLCRGHQWQQGIVSYKLYNCSVLREKHKCLLSNKLCICLKTSGNKVKK